VQECSVSRWVGFVFLYLYFHSHRPISEITRPNFTKFSIHVTGWPWLGPPLKVVYYIITLCTSSFMDDVVFSYNVSKRPESDTTHMFNPVCQAAVQGGGGEVFRLKLHLVPGWVGSPCERTSMRWLEHDFFLLFQSTPLSRSSKVGLKCLFARPYVRLSTKRFYDFNDIWCVGRGRWVMHDGVQYDPIQGQGQGHKPLKVGNSAIFKGCFLPHLQWGLANNHGFLH